MQGKVAAAMLLAVMLMSGTGDPLSPLGEGGGEGRILLSPQGSSWSVAFDRAGNLLPCARPRWAAPPRGWRYYESRAPRGGFRRNPPGPRP